MLSSCAGLEGLDKVETQSGELNEKESIESSLECSRGARLNSLQGAWHFRRCGRNGPELGVGEEGDTRRRRSSVG